MREVIRNHVSGKVVLLFWVVFTGWWLALQGVGEPGSLMHQIFAAVYGVVALWGGIWGIRAAMQWGGFKSIMGRALIFFSLGLFSQEFGQLAYSFYIYYLQVEVPYPSIGDIGYLGTIPLYIIGVFYLSQASGVNIGLQSVKSKVQAVIIPLVILLAGYTFFLSDYVFDWSSPLVIFLDFGYPLGDAIYISLALLTYLLTKNVLGGLMKKRVLFILLALCVQFFTDYLFLFQAKQGTWQVGGINDYMYLCSYVCMAMSLSVLNITAMQLKLQSS